MKNYGDRCSGIKEENHQPEGRTGGKNLIKMGPAASSKAGNPTSGGGINRATKGTSQR
jgi:hypothetical protein